MRTRQRSTVAHDIPSSNTLSSSSALPSRLHDPSHLPLFQFFFSSRNCVSLYIGDTAEKYALHSDADIRLVHTLLC